MENREKVPVRYRKNAQTAALLDTLGLSAQQMADLVEDVKKQFFIETATWSLPLWEQQVGIAPPTGAHRSITPQRTKGTPVGWRQYHCGHHPRHGYSDDRIRCTRHSQ